MVTIGKKRKQCHLLFKAICGPKVSNCWKCLILLVTVLFIREEWLRLLMLLKTGLPRQIFFEKLLQIHKIHSSIKILVAKWVKNWKKFSHGLSYFPPFHLLTSIFSILLALASAVFFRAINVNILVCQIIDLHLTF